MKHPHPRHVLDARDWLLAGAPAAAKDHDAPASVKTLLVILDVLPKLDARYNFGTDEWREAMEADPPK